MVSLKKSKKQQSSVESSPSNSPQITGAGSSPCLVDGSDNKNEETAANPGDFSNFAIPSDVVAKLEKRGISHLFPVQYTTFRAIYKGRDVVTQARTGSGKTLSFTLPIVSRLCKGATEKGERGRPPKVLVLAPTRELAVQIYDDFVSVVDPNLLAVDKFYGGQFYDPQETAIRRGLDVLVGTPGRILDLCDKGKLTLGQVCHVILDEADRMLEIGFKEHMDQILAHCTAEGNKPQMLLFSATMPEWVSEVAAKYMTKPRTFSLVESGNKTSTTVQHLAVRSVWQNRNDIVGDIVQQYSGRHGRAIVFTQTKLQADELAASTSINQDCQVLHGDVAQAQREVRLQGFRDGRFQCLVATDVAARGLDIPEVDLVIQMEPPKDVESYIHRSGRTGRAGRSGTSVCLYNQRSEGSLKEVERRAGIKFSRVAPPQPEQLIAAAVTDATRCLDDVPSDVLTAFKKHAKELLANRPAEDVLAAALAHVSGLTEIKKRSLLSSMEGYTAYQMSNSFEVRSPYFFWNNLEQWLGASFRADVKFMKLTKDKTGCVIDVPSKYEEFIADTWVDTDKMKLFKMTELPELEDFVPRGGNANNSGYGQRSSNGWGRGNGNSNGRSNGYNANGRTNGFKRKSDFGGDYNAKRTRS